MILAADRIDRTVVHWIGNINFKKTKLIRYSNKSMIASSERLFGIVFLECIIISPIFTYVAN